jgi:hypothetical protein
VESIKRRCELTGLLSNKQKPALDNIIEKFIIGKASSLQSKAVSAIR